MHYNIVPWQWDFVISLAWHKCEKSTGTGILGSGGPTGEFLVPGIRFKELMQFTDLLDKNGKGIYEGDIITCHTNNEFKYPHKEVVVWQDSIAAFAIRTTEKINDPDTGQLSDAYTFFMHNEDFEVIGNIYENPELLDP